MKKKILVVDDNRGAADSLVKLLQLLGHEVRAAYDGLSALSQAVEWHPDLIFLDLMMPEVDGFDVVARLRSKPDTKSAMVIALTGLGGEQLMAATREAGFDIYMDKPATAEKLIKLIAGNSMH